MIALQCSDVPGAIFYSGTVTSLSNTEIGMSPRLTGVFHLGRVEYTLREVHTLGHYADIQTSLESIYDRMYYPHAVRGKLLLRSSHPKSSMHHHVCPRSALVAIDRSSPSQDGDKWCETARK